MNKVNGKIYKNICNETNLCYYGSTCETLLCKRIAKHRNNYKRFTQGKLSGFCNSFKILQNGNYNIVLVKQIYCENMKELLDHERFFIENYECVNKNIPNRTKEEYKLILKRRRDIVKYFLKLPFN